MAGIILLLWVLMMGGILVCVQHELCVLSELVIDFSCWVERAGLLDGLMRRGRALLSSRADLVDRLKRDGKVLLADHVSNSSESSYLWPALYRAGYAASLVYILDNLCDNRVILEVVLMGKGRDVARRVTAFSLTAL